MSRVLSRSRRAAATPAVAGFRPAALAVAAVLALQPAAQAQTARSGTAAVTTNGVNTTVTTTNGAGHRSVIDWPALGVQAGHSLYFLQPDAVSTSINRVTGGTRSDIMGYLGSNGNLVLVNPSGIAIGRGAVIDTAGFTASTLGLSDFDAINGRLRFSGGSSEISVAEGARILARGGDVVLIGSRVQVERNAVLQAHGATILAAGEQVELTGRGLEGILMTVHAGNEAVNLGTLKGDAVGIFAGTLRHSGLIQAQAVSMDGGKVVLKAVGDNVVDGTVTASAAGGKGGSIDVFGEHVSLRAGAALDASGAQGGGSVRVGGDYQGLNPDVPNAKAVDVEAGATIKADATDNGDGGRVIVWSDGDTRMHGRISARGGDQGGDGGFAEVSGKKTLAFTGRADLRAPRGRTGTLLLDPNDIIIDATAATDVPVSTPAPGVASYSGGPSISHIRESDLESQLSESNVIIQTNGGTGGFGDITVASGVDIGWGGAYTLALQADRHIVLNGSVTGTDPSSVLSLQALGGTITQSAGSTVTVGNLLANAAGDITMAQANRVGRLSGNTTLGGANGNFTFNNTQDLTVGTVATAWGASFAGVKAGTGDVSITTAGSLTVAAAPPSVTPPPASSGVVGRNVTLQAQNDINLNGDITASGLANIRAMMGQINQLTASTVRAGSAMMQAGSSIDLQGTVSSRGGISITSDNGGISFNLIDARGDSSSLAAASGGNVTLKAKGDIVGSTLYAEGTFYAGEGGGSGGGNGGNVSVTSDNGGVFIDAINISSGSAGASTGVGGGEAGTLTIKTKSLAGGAGDVELNYVYAVGGSGDNATAGGTVTIEATNGSVSANDIDASGGYNSGSAGGTGGMGGKVTIKATGDIALAEIATVGGGSATGVGGQGGEIHLTTGGSLLGMSEGSLYLYAHGGNGGTTTAGEGTAGGKGGLVEVTRTGGDLVADNTWYVDAGGGQGGNAAMDESTHAGGAGGDGGDIKLAASGRVLLGDPERGSPQFYAMGGDGGVNSDDSTYATSGLLGNFRASGTSVEVNGNFFLSANWVNDSLVKLTGTSQVFLAGMFHNNNEVQLYDTAMLFPSYGLVNNGRLTSFGDNMVNLTLNTGTGVVTVASGSTLSTPAFLVNQGTVNVDGTLRIGDSPDLDLDAADIPTTGALFTNEASGTLAGTGTIVVSDGMGSVQNFGTIAPGGAGTVGALTIDGNLFVEAGSTYALDLLNAASHDTLLVTGSATTSGGTIAVNFLSGASFATGDSFNVLQSGGFDPEALPAVDKPQLRDEASGNNLLLIANAPYPGPPAPAPVSAPAPILNADQQQAQQEANNQVTTFADLFVKMSEDQEKKRIGKDDIVVTDTACTR